MPSSTDETSKKHRSELFDDDQLMKRRNSIEIILSNDDNIQYLSIDESLQLIDKCMKSKLPDTSRIFPWLHVLCEAGQYIDEQLLDNDQVICVRSSPCEGAIHCSGILEHSVNLTDFLVSLSDFGLNKALLVEFLKLHFEVDTNGFLRYDSRVSLNALIKLCLKFQVLPILKSHSISDEKSSRPTGRRVCSSVTLRKETWRQANALRRFDIQCAKMIEYTSNILVYCLNDHYSHEYCENCVSCVTLLNLALHPNARKIYVLQYKSIADIPDSALSIPLQPVCNMMKSELELVSEFEMSTINSWETNVLYHEFLELSKMSSACCMDQNGYVWSGNTTDYQVYQSLLKSRQVVTESDVYNSATLINSPHITYDPENPNKNTFQIFNVPILNRPWSLFIKCYANAPLPTVSDLMSIFDKFSINGSKVQHLSFPCSGSIGLGNLNIESISAILNVCYLIHQLSVNEFSTFFYCADGYTETSFILVAFLIFSWDLSLDKTLSKLHLEYQKPFFLFHNDLQVLGHLQFLLREFSPSREANQGLYNHNNTFTPLELSSEMFSKMFFIKVPQSSNFSKLKGPYPSRLLPHLYLGSLEHTHSQDLLKSLGINYIVSVGEKLSWLTEPNIQLRNRGDSTPLQVHQAKCMSSSHTQLKPYRRATVSGTPESSQNSNSSWSETIVQNDFKILKVNNIEDNGEDTISERFDEILDFIDECYKCGGKVLIHCMVGVSRSATVCVAECMRRLNCDVLQAYMFVRVRRLNIVIQPHLMFMYELLKWQEEKTGTRKIEWHILCRAIHELNRKYT